VSKPKAALTLRSSPAWSASTAFGIFFTSMFYVLLRALTGNRRLTQHGEASVASSAPAE
jgi:hypothetical protein